LSVGGRKRFDPYTSFDEKRIKRSQHHAKPSRAAAPAEVPGVGGPARARKGLQIVRPVVFLRAIG
jgi:hypothetical protein